MLSRTGSKSWGGILMPVDHDECTCEEGHDEQCCPYALEIEGVEQMCNCCPACTMECQESI